MRCCAPLLHATVTVKLLDRGIDKLSACVLTGILKLLNLHFIYGSERLPWARLENPVTFLCCSNVCKGAITKLLMAPNVQGSSHKYSNCS